MTYKGLTLGEWLGGWGCRVRMIACGLRGHPWGPWWYDAPDFNYGPATRMCTRCDAYEERA